MSKKKKLKAAPVPNHAHEWKALIFLPFEQPPYQVFGHVVAAQTGTRVGLECTCGARTFKVVALSEADARWMYKADREPVSIPDAILSAFGDEQ